MLEHMKLSHEVQGIVCGSPRQDCIEAQICGRVEKRFCSTEGGQLALWPQWKSLEPPLSQSEHRGRSQRGD